MVGTVLPSIRKIGGYGVPAPVIDVCDHAQLATITAQLITFNRELENRAERAEQQVTELVPRAAAWEQIANASGVLTISSVAKENGGGPH